MAAAANAAHGRPALRLALQLPYKMLRVVAAAAAVMYSMAVTAG
jgi:hypothetical protein